jgi:hypothetical protein
MLNPWLLIIIRLTLKKIHISMFKHIFLMVCNVVLTELMIFPRLFCYEVMYKVVSKVSECRYNPAQLQLYLEVYEQILDSIYSWVVLIFCFVFILFPWWHGPHHCAISSFILHDQTVDSFNFFLNFLLHLAMIMHDGCSCRTSDVATVCAARDRSPLCLARWGFSGHLICSIIHLTVADRIYVRTHLGLFHESYHPMFITS